jgi:AcrR family transcriptional regulator
MGRNPKFSREEALRTAMIAFWTKGYRRTSMRNLAEQLGVHLGKLNSA